MVGQAGSIVRTSLLFTCLFAAVLANVPQCTPGGDDGCDANSEGPQMLQVPSPPQVTKEAAEALSEAYATVEAQDALVKLQEYGEELQKAPDDLAVATNISFVSGDITTASDFFNILDIHDDGKLTQEEITLHFGLPREQIQIGSDIQKEWDAEDVQLHRGFMWADKDQDKRISFSEFMLLFDEDPDMLPIYKAVYKSRVTSASSNLSSLLEQRARHMNQAQKKTISLEETTGGKWNPFHIIESDPCDLNEERYGGGCWSDHVPLDATLAGMPVSGAHNAHAFKVGRYRPWHHSDDCSYDNQWLQISDQADKGVRFFDIDYDVGEQRGWHGFHLYQTIGEIVDAILNHRKHSCPNDIYWVNVNNVQGGSRTDAIVAVYNALASKISALGLPPRTLKVLDHYDSAYATAIKDGKDAGFIAATVLGKGFWKTRYNNLAGSVIVTTPEVNGDFGGPYDCWSGNCMRTLDNVNNEEYSDTACNSVHGKDDEMVIWSYFKTTRCDSMHLSADAVCKPRGAWEKCRRGNKGPTVFLLDNVEPEGSAFRCCEGSMLTLRSIQRADWQHTGSVDTRWEKIQIPGGGGCGHYWHTNTPNAGGNMLLRNWRGRTSIDTCKQWCLDRSDCLSISWYRTTPEGHCYLFNVRCSHAMQTFGQTVGYPTYEQLDGNTGCGNGEWCSYDRLRAGWR